LELSAIDESLWSRMEMVRNATEVSRIATIEEKGEGLS
jgi:hypothetical protein